MKVPANRPAVLVTTALLVITMLIVTPSLAMGAPVVVPDSNCFFSPAGASCVSIIFSEGPFANPTDDRSFAVYDTEQLLGGSGILAGYDLFNPNPPSRTQSDDFISSHVKVWNDGTNDVLTATVSGMQALGPGSTGTGDANYALGAIVNVTGKFESDSVPPGTNLQLPVQIDHDGGIGNPADVRDFQTGSSVAILWSGQATLFTNGTQTSIFSASLDVNEESVAINTSGFSGPDYVFTDTNGAGSSGSNYVVTGADGFFETYSNTTPIFDTVQIKTGEEFTLELTVYASIYSNYYVENPSEGDARIEQYFADTFEVGLVLPAGTTFVPVSTATPGDANGDGKVDGLDYLVWAGAFGDDPAQDPPGPPENGDFNNDGVVDGLDYLLWAGNFGQGPNDGVAVPEPASLATALLALAGLLAVSRRGRA